MDDVLSLARSYWMDRLRVKEYSADAISIGISLIDAKEMTPVWKDQYELAGDFPVAYSQIAAMQHDVWRRSSRLTAAKARSELRAAAGVATQLAQLVRQLGPEIALAIDLPLTLEEVLIETQRRGAQPISEAVRRRFQYFPLASISIPQVLEALARKLSRPFSSDLAAARPRKINDENAERTFFVRRLAQFLLQQFGETHPAWIAQTANVLFPDDYLDASHVGKLIIDLRAKRKVSAASGQESSLPR